MFSSQGAHELRSDTRSTAGRVSLIIRSISACLSRRFFGSFALPRIRKNRMPTKGMKKMASSHAIAAVGFRSRGMTMIAVILIARSRPNRNQVIDWAFTSWHLRRAHILCA